MVSYVLFVVSPCFPYMFLISLSFGASGGLCFVSVEFPGYVYLPQSVCDNCVFPVLNSPNASVMAILSIPPPSSLLKITLRPIVLLFDNMFCIKTA